jgi:hypothetical protein
MAILGFWIPAIHAGTTLPLGFAPWLKILANQEPNLFKKKKGSKKRGHAKRGSDPFI